MCTEQEYTGHLLSWLLSSGVELSSLVYHVLADSKVLVELLHHLGVGCSLSRCDISCVQDILRFWAHTVQQRTDLPRILRT